MGKNISIAKIFSASVLLVLVILVSVAIYKEIKVIDRERVEYQQKLSVPSTELLDLRKHESEMLNSYAVLDKDNEIYRIPIKRAMELRIKKQSLLIICGYMN